jgi:hypothetical protein
MRLMLKFNECDRPSFIDLAKILVANNMGTINNKNQLVSVVKGQMQEQKVDSKKGKEAFKDLQVQARPVKSNQGPESPVNILN